MKTDEQIQQDVMEELSWTPFLRESEIGVFVKNGVVTLSGQVASYSQKMKAENAAKKVAGVKAIAEDIHIGVSPKNAKTDTEIAEAVVSSLKWNSAVQANKIRIKVDAGIVTLEGEADWEYQRRNAVSAVLKLDGVLSVVNLIRLVPRTTPTEISEKIKRAFERRADLDAGRIHAEVSGNKVILTGTVKSLMEKEDAENAAWAAPGILSIDNRLQVEAFQYADEF